MNIIEAIRNKANIVEIIEERIAIIRRGKSIKALCPFHEDNNPSLIISESKQIFKCFSCGVGGDAFKFIMEFENLNFKETLKNLANKYGINLPRSFNLKDTTYIDPYLKEKNINQIVANTYHHYLFKAQKAELGRQYLVKRKINKNAITAFKIGFAPKKGNLLKNILLKKYSLNDILKTTLIKRNYNETYNDFFFNRLIFPIFNQKNEILGFGGRVIDDKEKPKYINSTEAPWFKKRETLYGLNQSYQTIIKKKEVYIVEGYFDVISLFSIKLPTVAPLGTSLTTEQLLKLKKLVEKIYLVMDSDRAGRLARLKAIKNIMEIEIDGFVIELNPYHDPFDLIDQLTPTKATTFLKEKQQHIYDYLLEEYSPKKANSPMLQKKNFLILLEHYQLLKDKYLRKIFAEKIEKKFKISPEKYFVEKKKIKPQTKKNKISPLLITKERELMIFLCSYPEYIKQTKSIFKIEDLTDNLAQHIFRKLILNDPNQLKKLENILKLFSHPNEKVIIDFITKKIIINDYIKKNFSPFKINQENEFINRISNLKLEYIKKKKKKLDLEILENDNNDNNEETYNLLEKRIILRKEEENLKNFIRKGTI